jgi:hypothetical protein
MWHVLYFTPENPWYFVKQLLNDNIAGGFTGSEGS